MLESFVDELKNTPTRIREVPQRLATRRRRLVASLRHRAHVARGESEERLWRMETSALEGVVDLLGNLDDLPVMGRVVPGAERLVGQALDQVTAVPVEGYADLNAKTAAKAVRGLSRVALLRVQRFEAGHKDRKTVLDAIDRELDKLMAEPRVVED